MELRILNRFLRTCSYTNVTYEDYLQLHSLDMDEILLNLLGVSIENTHSRRVVCDFYATALSSKMIALTADSSLTFSLSPVKLLFILITNTFYSTSSKEFWAGILDCFNVFYVNCSYIQKCEYFWRFLYGYGLVYYLYKHKKSSNENIFWHGSSFNELAILVKSFSNIFIPNLTKMFLSKLSIFSSFFYLTKLSFLTSFKSFLLNTTVWLPIFKKTSYIGFWANVRSKWFKKK